MTAPALPAWILELDLAVQHLLLREHDVDRWWRIHRDGSRTLVGGLGDVEALVRGWLAWDDCPQPNYVGERYTVARVDPVLLAHWPDATPVKEFR